MQIRFKYPLLLSAIAVLFFSSCSHKTNTEGRYIPSGASFVVHLNGQSLNAKLPWEEIKQSELFKQAYSDSSVSSIARSVLDNPENSGVDVKKDILFFMVKEGDDGYIVVEGTIKDEAKFKQFNKDVNKNLAVESEKSGLHFSEMPEVTTAWNKDKFLLLMDGNMKNRYKMNSTEANKKRIPFAESIFNLSEDKSLGEDEKFSELMRTSGDIHLWINTESLQADNSMPDMGPINMFNLKKVYEDSRVTGTINFDNGKINADFKSYYGKEMTDLIKKYSGDKINADMVKRIPSKDVAALIAFNFKPEGLKEYLKLLGMDGFANMGGAQIGFNLDDFIKANKGDILLAVTDINMDSLDKPKVSAFFSAAVGDKPSFTKLVEAGKNLAGKAKLDQMEFMPSLFYNMNDKYFTIGTNKQAVDTYINTQTNNSFDFFDKISGSAGGAYINFQYIIKSLGSKVAKDSLNAALYDASLKMWDNLTAAGTGFKDGGSTQHIEVNLVDKNTNSLKQLNNFLATFAVIKKKQQEAYRTQAMDRIKMADPSMIPVVPTK